MQKPELLLSWIRELEEISVKICLVQQGKGSPSLRLLCLFSFPRKRAACKSVNGSHKYKGNSKDVKPPDLWIHHERLELKPMDKSPDPNPIMTDTPIPRNSQDITPVDNSMDSNIHQRRNSYRGEGPDGTWAIVFKTKSILLFLITSLTYYSVSLILFLVLIFQAVWVSFPWQAVNLLTRHVSSLG